MTLKLSQVMHTLQSKRDDLANFGDRAKESLNLYRKALEITSTLTSAELLDQLKGIPPDQRSSEPLEPLGGDPNWVKPFGTRWDNREQSLEWARRHITNVATVAVDGSQIYPSKDVSIPIALVQVGWYENFHTDDGRYEKDVDFDILTPQELRVNNSGEPVDRRVNMRRFEMEIDRLIGYMKSHAGCLDCLAFFDGSLVVSFADAFDQETRKHYLRCVSQLMQASEAYRVPVVAYIDTSYAGDLMGLLRCLKPTLPDAPSLSDATLVGKYMQWGDRTPLFRCRRPGILADYPASVANQIAFTYLKAHNAAPVRLELPVWIYETSRHEQILDWVRCEIIIGQGYPYVIETADQTAVLTTEDRHTFYRLLQEWATQTDLKLHFSRKLASKTRRR